MKELRKPSFTLLGDSRNLDAGEIWKMIVHDQAKDMSWTQILRRIRSEELANIFPEYEWQSRPGLAKGKIRMNHDFRVIYKKSRFAGKPCYYIEVAKTQYVFVEEK